MARTHLGDALDALPTESATVVGLISGSQFVNHAFLVLLPPILPILSGEFEVSLALVGVALGAQAAVNTAFQLPFGYLADNYDRTLALGLSSVLGAVGALVTALAPDFATLVVGQVVLGIGVAGHHPSHYPLLTDATTEAVRGRAFAVYNFGGSLGFATPPVVITAVIALEGLTWRHGVGLFGAIGLVYAVVLVAAFAFRVDDRVTAPNVDATATSESGAGRTSRAASIRTRIRSKLEALADKPGILALAVLALFESTANWGITSYAVVFLTDVYDLPLSTANVTLTGLFVVGAGAILVSGHLTDRVGGGAVLIASFVGFTVLVTLIGVGVVPAFGAVLLFLILGGVRSLAGPARDELTERLAVGGTVGTSFAVVTVGMMLGSAIAPPVFGYLIEWAGVQTAIFSVAGAGLLATVVTALVVARFGDADASPQSPSVD